MTPEKRRECQARWLRKPGNRDKARAAAARWRASHKAWIAAYGRAWRMRRKAEAEVLGIEAAAYVDWLAEKQSAFK